MSAKKTSLLGNSDYVYQDDIYLVGPGSDSGHAYQQVADATGFGGPGVGFVGGSPGVGGGGGEPRLVTTYTSGNPNVDDANEFNIQINFEGKWTPQQQAVIEWAADFYSHIIT